MFWRMLDFGAVFRSFPLSLFLLQLLLCPSQLSIKFVTSSSLVIVYTYAHKYSLLSPFGVAHKCRDRDRGTDICLG